jgi:hypothetical protein
LAAFSTAARGTALGEVAGEVLFDRGYDVCAESAFWTSSPLPITWMSLPAPCLSLATSLGTSRP